jgi:glutamate dehydrogenase/leucine dehydrogenase
MLDHPSFDDHEGVHTFFDAATGLRCVIAVHSTALGPAAGGCRMWNYVSGEAMLTDVLRLSQGMSYKNAMAGIPLGGGKAVIWGDPKSGKSADLFRAFGRAVQSLNGSNYTAEDVGVDVSDMATVREETRFVAGLSEGDAASGDPSPVTARGVYLGIREVARRLFGTDDLNGRTIAVQGVGSVGVSGTSSGTGAGFGLRPSRPPSASRAAFSAASSSSCSTSRGAAGVADVPVAGSVGVVPVGAGFAGTPIRFPISFVSLPRSSASSAA